MSSRGSAALAKPLTREELEELARRLPYQRVRDSPTHPYYTNWKAFQLVEAGELAREAAEPPFTAKAQPTALLYPAGVRVEAPPRGVYVEPLSPEALGEWRVPVEGRLDALHALRWASGLRVWATGGSRGRVVVWLLGGRSGYAGYHVEVTVEPDAELELVLVAYTSPGSAMTATTLSSVGERATLRLASVNLGGGAVYFRRVAAVGEDARVESRIAALGGDMVHDREDNFIVGARGSATVAASLSSAGGQRLDAVENVILRAPSTAGRVTARGIVNGQSYLVSRGVARVERQASEGSAAYESTVLVMDEGGKG
nr:SufD family Fe-S cluster assembly protein [Desulfurococcales archaeon]